MYPARVILAAALVAASLGAPVAAADSCVDLLTQPCFVGTPSYCGNYPAWFGLILRDEVVVCWTSTVRAFGAPPPPPPPRYCVDWWLPQDPGPDPQHCTVGVGVFAACENGNGFVVLVLSDNEIVCVR